MRPGLDLSHFGLTLESLLEILEREAPIASGDLLLACGSIPEGLGNDRSDLDLCLITAATEPEIDPGRNRVVLAGRLICDILSIHPSAVAALARRLDSVSQADGEMRRAAKAFTYFEKRLLHRLATGVPLLPGFGAPTIEDLSGERITLAALSRHRLKEACYEAMALRLDLAGLRDSSEWASLIFATQELLRWSLSGILAACEATNPTPKWQAKLLDRLPEGALGAIPGIDPAMRPAALAVELNSAPPLATGTAATRYASRIAAFARAALFWAEQRLFPSGAPIPNAFVAQAEKGLPGERLPALALDVQFRAAPDGLEVFRLNRAGGRVVLDADLAPLPFLMDGRTTFAEAEGAFRRAGLAVDRPRWGALVTVLEGGGLTALDPIDESALQALLGEGASGGRRF